MRMMTIKKIVILSDLQVPFEDTHVALNIARFLGSFKPDQTVTIGDEIDFVLSEVNRLRLCYPGLLVAPILYRVEDHLLYLIDET